MSLVNVNWLIGVVILIMQKSLTFHVALAYSGCGAPGCISLPSW